MFKSLVADKLIFPIALSLALSGCQTLQDQFETVSTTQRYVIPGPDVIDNTTPVDPAFACLADYIREKKMPRVAISVGNIKDYTGKYSEAEGGSAITQGGSLMVISALGKLDETVAVRERFDTTISDREFAYMEKQRLGDGKSHIVRSKGKNQKIHWIPKVGGAVQKSQVYIVGGITELNYNLSTGGFTTEIVGVGPRVRQFTISVAADLRLINTSNLNVVKSVSLQKQVVGYEIKAGIFRFFGDNLYNIEAGAKSQEPLQLAVRTILEMATLELVSKIYSFDYELCFDPVSMKAENSRHAIDELEELNKLDEPSAVVVPQIPEVPPHIHHTHGSGHHEPHTHPELTTSQTRSNGTNGSAMNLLEPPKRKKRTILDFPSLWSKR